MVTLQIHTLLVHAATWILSLERLNFLQLNSSVLPSPSIKEINLFVYMDLYGVQKQGIHVSSFRLSFVKASSDHKYLF